MASKETFKYLKKKEIPFSLEIKENVPVSRGLGSSATCIIAGVITAMLLSDAKLDDEEIVNIASMVEGHPDNIVPAYYGSLTSAFINGDEVIHTEYNVDSEVVFTLLVPPFSLDTKTARGVLPKEVSMKDAIYSLSRAIAIPKALEEGDINKLYYLFSDHLHEPYRYPLIKDSEVFIDFSKKNKIPLSISGSGSTLLMASSASIKPKLEKLETKEEWNFYELKVCKKGTSWRQI